MKMNQKRWSKLNNRGASLIAVLVAIVVVGVMGSVVMQLTITNLQMKEVERQSKRSFYSAEDFMGYFTNQINVKSAKQLQEAFNDMLAMYKTVSQSELGLRKAFSKAYLDRMISVFGVVDPAPNQEKVSEEVVYELGYFNVAAVTDLVYDPASVDVSTVVPDTLRDTAKYGFYFPELSSDHTDCTPEGFYHADYTAGTFTLSGICVYAKDANGNYTKIKTDLVFHTPDVNLNGSNVVKEFMRYSLIADKQIVFTQDGTSVDGNVYAGDSGILCNHDCFGSLIGKKIVTRGDIAAMGSDDGVFQVGNPSNSSYSQIWVQNYKTLNDSAMGAQLYISGDSYVADDLSVDGDNSVVVITGGYYGYNFQENYLGANVAPTDSAYSSAIMINGKNAMVDLTDLSSLMVYGRSYVGRNKNVDSGSNDIRMGEAIAVKSNQIAYYVPNDCVVGGILDKDAYRTYSGVDVSSYVTGNGVTEYHFKDNNGVEQTSYYLKFGSDQAANNFYFDYFNNKKVSMLQKASRYISGSPRTFTIAHDDGTTESVSHYSLQITTENKVMRGDYIYTDASGNLVTAKWSIPGGYWSEGQTYHEYAKDHAIRYKSLVLSLEDKNDPDWAGSVRLTDADPNLYDNLIDSDQWNGFFSAHSAELVDGTKFVQSWKENEDDPDSGIILALINNTRNDPGQAYTIPDTLNGVSVVGGLVIANGDVNVPSNFRGTIISGGVIKLNNGGCEVKADEVLISTMISKDAMLKSNALFAKLFKDYSESAEDVMSGSSIEKYMTFDNWTKSVE